MRIQLKIEGGVACFPGLSKPIRLDSRDLSAEDAAELERLVREANFFALPAEQTRPQRGAADYRQYTLTVEDAGRTHTVQLTDPIENAHLSALVTFVQRKRLRPGGAKTPPP